MPADTIGGYVCSTCAAFVPAGTAEDLLRQDLFALSGNDADRAAVADENFLDARTEP